MFASLTRYLVKKEKFMNKILLSTFASLISIVSFATEKKQTDYVCRALVRENQVVEKFDFKFKCDNYGEDATFTSKTGRFKGIAYSTESCEPYLIVNDTKTKSVSFSTAKNDQSSAFNVFHGNIVSAALISAVDDIEDILSKDKKWDAVVMGCSTDPALLEELDFN